MRTLPLLILLLVSTALFAQIVVNGIEKTDSCNKKHPDTQLLVAKNKVRLSKIVVDTVRLDEYNTYLKEEIEASMRLEPGVLTLYAVSEKEHPDRITILEIYADETAYQSHIKTPHFLKYKEGTLDMVLSLELIDTNPLIPELKIK